MSVAHSLTSHWLKSNQFGLVLYWNNITSPFALIWEQKIDYCDVMLSSKWPLEYWLSCYTLIKNFEAKPHTKPELDWNDNFLPLLNQGESETEIFPSKTLNSSLSVLKNPSKCWELCSTMEILTNFSQHFFCYVYLKWWDNFVVKILNV